MTRGRRQARHGESDLCLTHPYRFRPRCPLLPVPMAYRAGEPYRVLVTFDRLLGRSGSRPLATAR